MIKINFAKLSKFERGTFRIWIILSSLWLLYLLLFVLVEGKCFLNNFLHFITNINNNIMVYIKNCFYLDKRWR